MNKTFSTLLLIFFITVFKINAQIYEPGDSINKQHKTADILFKKLKNQKTAAWILLGAGAGAAIAGGIVATNANEDFNPDDPFDIFPRGSLAGGAMILGGVAVMITSVPFFIVSGRNKKKAYLIFQNDSQSFLHRLHKANVFSAGISLRL